MLAAWKQTMGPDTSDGPSHVITIGDTKLDQGPDWKFEGGADLSQKSNQHNCNIRITNMDKVKKALDKDPEVVITYKTVTDALPGWYSNFASVDGLSGYSDYVFYYVESETKPSVEKSVKKMKMVRRHGGMRRLIGNQSMARTTKVRGLSTGRSMSIELRLLPMNLMARASLMVKMSLLKMSFLME